MRRIWLAGMALLLLAVPPCGIGTQAAEQPLSKDDVTLLLIGGATSDKMIPLIESRGVDFQMTPDLAKRFHDLGASDAVIEALQRAGKKVASSPPPAPPAKAPSEPPRTSQPQEVEKKISETLAGLSSTPGTTNPEDYPLAPTFSLVAFSGQKLDLEDYKGKVVLLDFWATWCGPCRIEIPEFVRLQDRYFEKGFRIIGIAVDDQKEAVRKFYNQYNMNYPVAMGNAQVRKLYGGVHSLPTTLLIGRDGRIYAKVEGAPADLRVFEARLKSLLAAPAGQQMAAVRQGDGSPADPPSAAGNPQAAPASPPAAAQASDASASKPAPAPAASSQAAPAVTQPASARTSKPAGVALSDPSPDEIQKVIEEFAGKEKLFRQARDNYTYHQVNKVQQLDVDENVVGVFQQEWDILYDDKGGRIERVTYAPPDTLQGLTITAEDLESFRSIQPFVLTTDELPEYDVKYLGHVRLDELTAYVFSIRPKEIKKGRQYFQGVVWVDDRDLQIVKTEGKSVPESRPKKGQENLFPRFMTYREQIDGKYWFPTFTIADDTLYFSSGPVHIKQVIKYMDYKQFKATYRILSTTPIDEPAKPAAQSPANAPKK